MGSTGKPVEITCILGSRGISCADDLNAPNQEYASVRGGKGTNGAPKSARYVQSARNVGSPKGREPYGDGVLVVV